MATAAYVDVVVDPGLIKLNNRARNRRSLFLAMLTAGCFVLNYRMKIPMMKMTMFYLNRQSTFIQLFKSTFIIKGVSEQYILSSPSSAEVLPPDQAHNGLPSVLEPR